ncbi:asialoglycoprotein receptor 1-like isoform X1 [Salvelinus fontinalis]|uniref:asialoglycoprotein receptor 1-like isoform X1 n=1 Tax=Salvelinus fontinalis TaxID=8038 RepID=UPI00248622F0|nr:asialoglycoprotein receptor 1-like isoform X1 [Salvelinus fontinalis]
MMSGEIIYSDVTFTRHQNQDTGAESEVSNGVAEREEDVTYSEVRRPGGRASEQEDPGKGRDPGNSDPTPPMGSKATIPDGGSGRVPVATLVCLCVLLLGLAITLGVLYASNMTSLQAEGARFAQMKDNLTGKLHDLQDSYKRLQNKTLIITVQEELFSSGLRDCEANLTRVKDLLATIQGNPKECNADTKPCSPGWEFYNGSCYYFSIGILTWEQSQYACIRDGGHLVIIESQQEQEFIKEKIVRSTDFDNSPWIGLTDKKQEGVWVWMDNTTLDDRIKFWDPNTETFPTLPEPNDWNPGEDCARMGQSCSSRIKCWFDFACDQPCRRICESRAVCERRAATS